MKAFLMFPDRDFDPDLWLITIANPYPRRDIRRPEPWEDLPPLSEDPFPRSATGADPAGHGR